MKKRIMMIVTLLLAIYNMAKAEDRVTISDFRISAGETKEVSITLDNDVAYVAFQFDLYLPEGITVESYSADRSRMPEGTTLDMSQQQDGSYRFISAAMSGEPIKGSSGSIVLLTVRASEWLPSGEMTGYFRKVKLAKADATGPTYEEMAFPVTVIEPSVVTVTSCRRQYGEANPTFEYTVSGGALEGTPAISCEANENSPVGDYPIMITQGTVSNYNVTYIAGTLTIESAPLIISAGNYTKRQYEPMPEFTLSYDGFKNNETSAVLTTQPVVTCDATEDSAPGVYPVIVSGASAQNYAISYINGTLTVTEPVTYTLTYMVDGEVYKTLILKQNEVIIPEPEPIKEGYTFSGWSEIPATMPAHDVTVTGTFSINTYKLTYMVDGQTYKTYDVEYGDVITPEPAPTKEGYTFSGWSDIPATMPAHDVTVTGTFSINTYKLTYLVDGQTYKMYDVEYGASITPEAAPIKEGYTFSGWSEIPETMPAHDVTVTGTFSINTYKLTYVVDGQTYKTYDVEYGASITPEAAPEKEGYTFSGWSEIPEVMPAHDVTVTGTFSINTYKLTYVVDGQTYKTYDVEYGAAITPEAEPTKEGYTFSGWSEIPATMPAHDVTVTGTFSINTYKLTYVVDGQTYKTYDVVYGASITPEPAPTKEGYTFSGWSEIPATMPAHDVTVTGTFSINKYKLTYVVDGQTYKTYDVEYGAAITPEPAPVREGYTFSGWSEIPETMPAHDVTVTGSFAINTYKLTYVVDGQTYKTYDVEYGSVITPEPAPTKEGYTFSGWSEIPATMPAHDVTVTGTFTKGSYKLTYLVDGEVYKTVSYDYGDVVTPEPAPVREGYTFSGWSEIPTTMPAHDVTVTGTFSINKYILTYLVDGEEYKSYELEYGATITPESEPTKEGYKFSGWSEIPSTMPAHDVTVTGTFSINSYKLTYVVDGQTYKTYDVEYGTAITPEEEPTKEGYTFSGWSEIPETMPAHDVTVTGSFAINTYKLTYVVDGETYKTYELEYGTAITPEAEPTKEGYTFSGWSEIPTTMPAHDVTVTGTFTANKYILTYIVDGEEYKSYELEYGAAITPEAEPTKEGYTFSGWSEIPATMPAHDVTVTGSFTKGAYKLIYMVGGEVYKTFSYDYGDAITPEPAPTKEGYTFSGWSEIPATMPAHDVTVTGTFSINAYKLTYVLDGQTYKTYDVEYGASITPEAEPTKEGYTFSGWDGLPETMPAHDVTVTGTFSINSYKLTYMIDDVVYKAVMYEYGATIVPEPQPDGDYISFEWVGLPETMPANDVTVYAIYETGIFDIMTLQGIKAIYAPNGKKLDKLQKGLNIVVMQDGTVKKIKR